MLKINLSVLKSSEDPNNPTLCVETSYIMHSEKFKRRFIQAIEKSIVSLINGIASPSDFLAGSKMKDVDFVQERVQSLIAGDTCDEEFYIEDHLFKLNVEK